MHSRSSTRSFSVRAQRNVIYILSDIQPRVFTRYVVESRLQNLQTTLYTAGVIFLILYYTCIIQYEYLIDFELAKKYAYVSYKNKIFLPSVWNDENASKIENACRLNYFMRMHFESFWLLHQEFARVLNNLHSQNIPNIKYKILFQKTSSSFYKWLVSGFKITRVPHFFCFEKQYYTFYVNTCVRYSTPSFFRQRRKDVGGRTLFFLVCNETAVDVTIKENFNPN